MTSPNELEGAGDNLIDELMTMFADGYVDKLTYRAAKEIVRLEEALASITRERDEARALLGVESINGVLGYCLEQDRCGCGGDVPAIRATCDNWCKLKEQSAALVNGEVG
ncbi:hypothetical protein J2X45_003886 [Caulobacter sp. BE264]|uniref:hypothetical protein n=1 Tax=Caulobacter sp. BE264 TaxID=2817724 RepID=UPI002860DB1F|nr:hypothetical protein [Caulobacter sp. BE264]MDR7232776.1 hypothetical protein [Caulobacter sp. BE264]